MANLDLKLLALKDKLSLKNIDGRPHVFDPVRRKNIVLQPEEYVRQLMLIWLHQELGVPYALMALEKKIQMKESYRRFDIVCYDRKLQPMILVECKSFDVPITEAVARQISIYNQVMQCPYLLITNGQDSMIYQIGDDGMIAGLDELGTMQHYFSKSRE